MKKQILFSTGLLISGLLSAQVAKKANKFPAAIANMSATKIPTKQGNQPATTTSGEVKLNKGKTQKTAAFTSNVIGTTYYDLQSNSSVGDRITVNQDGTIAAVWTMETTNDKLYPNRGTGYAYFNGSTWSAAPTAKIEADRVGWGNIVNTRSGKELILSHNGNLNLLNLASRPVKGTGSWTESTTTVPSATVGGNFWPRMVNSGDTVYAISVTQQTVSGGALYQGLNGAICFSRSKDAGVNWDVTNVIPTGLDDVTRFRGFGGDSYAIAAKGSTVAVVGGDSGKDLVLSKSTDGGVTWTKTTILQFPIAKWDPSTTITDINSDGVADTVDTNDGTFSVALDNNNMAYVFYGNMRILQTTPQSNGGYSYFPITDGLNMWKEGMPANVGGTVVAQIEDLGEQGTIFFPSVASGLFPVGLWDNSLTSFPSASFDASNTLYLAYSSIVDSLRSTPNADKLLRHVYVIKSSDGGTTWTDPCDIVGSPIPDLEFEGVFPSMAKRVDGNVHLIYQRDLGAGNGIPGTTTANPDESENSLSNDIVYFKFPVSEIGACSIDVSVKENKSIVSDLSFYPNPASSNGTIDVVLKENAKMTVVVLNSVGQTVYSSAVQGNAGSNKIDINTANLSGGLYFYQVRVSDSKAVTKKFVVEK